MTEEQIKKVEKAIHAGAKDTDAICKATGLSRVEVHACILALKNQGRL